MFCILCETKIEKELLINNKKYFLCSNCGLFFVTPEFRLSKKDEYERYLKHQNSYDNKGYVDYLSGIADKCYPYINSGARCLDYGCGEGLVMEKIFRSRGYDMSSYDPYFKNADLSLGAYDFIICNEVAEHFYEPFYQFKKLIGLLKKEGVLVVGTMLQPEEKNLVSWFYLKDDTHVVFYSLKTFEYLASINCLDLFDFKDNRLVFFRKKG